jgi:hypothetical protein
MCSSGTCRFKNSLRGLFEWRVSKLQFRNLNCYIHKINKTLLSWKVNLWQFPCCSLQTGVNVMVIFLQFLPKFGVLNKPNVSIKFFCPIISHLSKKRQYFRKVFLRIKKIITLTPVRLKNSPAIVKYSLNTLASTFSQRRILIAQFF